MIAFAIFCFLQMLAPFGTFCLHNSEKFVKFVVIKTPGFTITNQRMQTSTFYHDGAIPHSLFSNSFTDISLLHSSKNGMTEVYKAQRMGKWYVLKCVTEAEASNPRMQQLLQKEYEIGFHLNHPFVVQTIGIEQVPDLDTCIVMEYVDGLNWDDFMA